MWSIKYTGLLRIIWVTLEYIRIRWDMLECANILWNTSGCVGQVSIGSTYLLFCSYSSLIPLHWVWEFPLQFLLHSSETSLILCIALRSIMLLQNYFLWIKKINLLYETSIYAGEMCGFRWESNPGLSLFPFRFISSLHFAGSKSPMKDELWHDLHRENSTVHVNVHATRETRGVKDGQIARPTVEMG